MGEKNVHASVSACLLVLVPVVVSVAFSLSPSLSLPFPLSSPLAVCCVLCVCVCVSGWWPSPVTAERGRPTVSSEERFNSNPLHACRKVQSATPRPTPACTEGGAVGG